MGKTMSVIPAVWNRRPCENSAEISVPEVMVSTAQIYLLHAEALASFGTTSREHRATTLRGHTGAKAVAHRPLVFIGLIGALHGFILY